MNSYPLMLDMPTMAFASGVSGFLMAATMLGIYHAGMRARAMLDWLLAGLAFGFGHFVGILMPIFSIPFPDGVGVSLANALISLGHAFVLVGVQRYLGNRARVGLFLGVIAVLFVAGFSLEVFRETLRARVLIFSGLHMVLSGWAGILLWRSHRPGMQSFHRMAAAVLLGFSVVLALRFLNALTPSDTLFSISQVSAQTISFLAAMIFGFLVTMAFAVMMFREKQVELTGLAEKDPLTGMNNRLSLDAIAERYMDRSQRTGAPLSVLLFDLDHFKRVNDEFGHQTGDRVLSEVARRIEKIIRGEDVAFRFGGEEFLALLPGASLDQAEVVAERLRSVFAEKPIEVDGIPLELTASFGVVQYMPGKETWEGCIRRVDQALYRAKRDGRDRVSRHLPVSILSALGPIT